MSDASQGPGWWRAADGKWYPPRSTAFPPPDAVPPPGAVPPLYGYPAPRQSNGTATASLVLGIIGLLMCGPFTGIPAIITGVKARREIAASGGRQEGLGVATAGLVLGWISTLLTGLAIAGIVALAILGNSVSDDYDPYGPDGINSDPSDGYCNEARYWQDPDC